MPKKQQFASAGEFISFLLQSNDDPSVDQVKSAVFVVRQIFAVVLGLIAGIMHLTGILTIIGFALASMGFAYYYVFKYLQVDEEKVENTEIYWEGFPVSFGEFMLIWTLVFTATAI